MKKLHRSPTNKMLAGVCGGIGEYFNIDPTLVRIGFFLLLLPGGLPGLVPYAILWFLMPYGNDVPELRNDAAPSSSLSPAETSSETTPSSH